MDKKKKKGKAKKKKDKKEKKKQPSALDGAHSKRTLGKPKFPCNICKGDNLLKECPGLSRVQEEWSKRSKPFVSSTPDHHVDDTPSTSDPFLKSRKGKVRNTCLLCKDMHFSYLFPLMDEAFKLLEYFTIPR